MHQIIQFLVNAVKGGIRAKSDHAPVLPLMFTLPPVVFTVKQAAWFGGAVSTDKSNRLACTGISRPRRPCTVLIWSISLVQTVDAETANCTGMPLSISAECPSTKEREATDQE